MERERVRERKAGRKMVKLVYDSFSSHVTHTLLVSPSLDINSGRLEVAKRLGASHIVLVTSRDTQEMARTICNTLGTAPDITIECSGAQPAIAMGIYVS